MCLILFQSVSKALYSLYKSPFSKSNSKKEVFKKALLFLQIKLTNPLFSLLKSYWFFKDLKLLYPFQDQMKEQSFSTGHFSNLY